MRQGSTTALGPTAVVRQTVFTFDSFELDPERLELRHGGIALKADPMVLRLLTHLVEGAGELVTKQELFTRVWGGRAVSDNVLTVAMTRLRRTLSQNGAETVFISNVFGRGYRFVRPVVRRESRPVPIIEEHVAAVSGMPLFGRESVLKAMRGVLSDVARGRGHVCIVSGEAGIGKTRTAEELAREASSAGMTVVWAYCRERGTTPPLWPFAQLVRGALAEGHLHQQSASVRHLLRELSQLLPEPEPC